MRTLAYRALIDFLFTTVWMCGISAGGFFVGELTRIFGDDDQTQVAILLVVFVSQIVGFGILSETLGGASFNPVTNIANFISLPSKSRQENSSAQIQLSNKKKGSKNSDETKTAGDKSCDLKSNKSEKDGLKPIESDSDAEHKEKDVGVRERKKGDKKEEDKTSATADDATRETGEAVDSFPFLNAIESVSSLCLRMPAQICGGVAGAFLTWELVPEAYHYTLTGPLISSSLSLHSAFLVEFSLTLALNVLVLWVLFSDSAPSSLGLKALFLVGGTLAAVLTGLPYTGPSLNPAFAFGWAVKFNKYRTWEHLYVYWLAAIAGGIAASLIYRLLFHTKGLRKIDNTYSRSEKTKAD